MAKSPKKSWDRLESLPMGDKSAQPIYTNVGIALSEFEMLQSVVNGLLQAVIGLRSSVLFRAFGALKIVSSKRDMIVEAAKFQFASDKATVKKINDFMTQYVELSYRRNEIAHAYVSHVTEIEKGQIKVDKGCFLHPGPEVTDRHTKLPKTGLDALGDYRYTAAQIAHYRQDFRRLWQEIEDFKKELSESRGKDLPASSQEISVVAADTKFPRPSRRK